MPKLQYNRAQNDSFFKQLDADRVQAKYRRSQVEQLYRSSGIIGERDHLKEKETKKLYDEKLSK